MKVGATLRGRQHCRVSSIRIVCYCAIQKGATVLDWVGFWSVHPLVSEATQIPFWLVASHATHTSCLRTFFLFLQRGFPIMESTTYQSGVSTNNVSLDAKFLARQAREEDRKSVV